MKPRIPDTLLPAVRAAIPNCAESRPFKCDLGRGRTLYAVVINREGIITRVGERAIHTRGDIGFSPAAIVGVTPC